MILKFGMGNGYVYPPSQYGYVEVNSVNVTCRKLEELRDNFLEKGIKYGLKDLIPHYKDICCDFESYGKLAQEFNNISESDVDKDNDKFTQKKVLDFIDSYGEYKIIVFYLGNDYGLCRNEIIYGFTIGEPVYVMNESGKSIDSYSGR